MPSSVAPVRCTARSLVPVLAEHKFHCIKCGRSGNALDLWAQATGQCIYDAAIHLRERLHIPLPLLAPQSIPRHREEQPVAAGTETCTIT